MFKHTTTLVVLLLLVFSIGTSYAQLKNDANLWTLNLGFSQVKNSTTENSLDAYSFNTTFEKLIGNSGFSVGMNMSYLWADDAYVISPDANAWVNLKSFAWYLTGKYYFNRSGLWTPYVGLGLGVHTNYQEVALSGVFTIQDPDVYLGNIAVSSFAVAGAVGINAFVSPDVYIGFNVAPVWLENSFYNSDLNWIFNLGVGFQFD